MTTRTGPGSLDTLSLLAEVADGLVVATARDTHLAWLDRVHGLVGPAGGLGEAVHHAVHRSIASSAYAGVGAGLRGASLGMARLARTSVVRSRDRRLEDGTRGRFVRSAVNGLIGDRLAAERPEWALPMTVRRHDRDVEPDAGGLAAAYPDATGRLVVFLHGLCENESYWDWQVERRGPGYPEVLGTRGWTPVMLRANTGLPLLVNGTALAVLLQEVVDGWPVPVDRIALVGHSMGGLVMRAAAAVVGEVELPWAKRVTDVVTLGTPHLGAPLAHGIGRGATHLARFPETGAFGRVLDWRSRGVHDLVEGLGEDVPALPHARYRLVSGTVTASSRHPVARWLGDALVRQPSAYGVGPGGSELFPGAEVLHVPRADHMTLLNHPRVHAALREWLD